MDMQTVSLSRIVEELVPEMVPFLTEQELQLSIVLRDGLAELHPEDAVEIVHQSIYELQKQVMLH
ncbi:hypothetical protein IDH44_12615 [Paenibacillus sp. IB182496]|uniref:Uncharacterized protein n=2 Tax=Paenibacillus sabuli TaxID=2772509 RepID=A0A927BUS8_9BACL|nr:hypothetical protein [Paenibacillus sabuli]